MAQINVEEETAAEPTATMCRICYENDSPDNMISPCKCSGSIRYVHRVCLEAHLLVNKRLYNCSVCNSRFRFRFRVIRKPLSQLLVDHKKIVIPTVAAVLFAWALLFYRIWYWNTRDMSFVNQSLVVRYIRKVVIGFQLNERWLNRLRTVMVAHQYLNALLIVSMLFLVVYGLWKMDLVAIHIIE